MANIIGTFATILVAGAIGYYIYYMWFIFPKKLGVPYFIHFDDVTNPPDISQNKKLREKVKFITHSPNLMNWEVKGMMANERYIKQTIMSTYSLTDKQVKISAEARWAYEHQEAYSKNESHTS